MATDAEKAVYPLATPTGQDIPFDVGDPLGLFIVDFTSAVSADQALPAGYEVLTLWATANAIVRFGEANANVTRGADQSQAVWVPVDTPVNVRIPLGETEFTVIGLTGSGVLLVQAWRKWQGLSAQVQQSQIG